MSAVTGHCIRICIFWIHFCHTLFCKTPEPVEESAMRLATVRTSEGTSAGRVADTHIELLPFRDVGELLGAGPDWRVMAEGPAIASIELADADFAPLVPKPEKIICVGANYQGHLAEIGLPKPEYPTVFAKYSRALIGANDPIALSSESSGIDWEVELGVIIGSPIRHATTAEALDAVAGYTIINDISMRDWQVRTSQFLQGKTFEATTPIGPYLVTPDEVDHAGNLRMTCSVDGAVMQAARTGEMLFPVAELLSYLSTIITLVPGDVIATGTPEGVGAFHRPPKYLAAGQIVTTEIEGLGRQVNRCRADTDALAG
ncbi:fumarylacetoacetate hydrolase family protein [Nocardia cyriacigeorgica]|uniref:fumarylacetoacetate hydrolase family protein n=1 Tax=Nocardia cyriacigeorgica TaxID=135487 RepID=UPI002B4B3618|nr:fumarylacetoacetate hydrolase family protein [Nocardia cyriacigeorgica]